MKHGIIPEGNSLTIDYSRPGVPASAEILQPDLIKAGNTYQCIRHADETEAIAGEGAMPEEASQEWDKNVRDIW